jgi:hypothetical protein
VSISCEARTPAYDGSQCSGFRFFSISPQQQLTVQLGQTPLPAGLETAISHMSKGETAVFVLPADQLRAPAASSSAQQAGAAQQDSSKGQQQHEVLIPHPPAKAVQVELCIQLHDLVQVGRSHMPGCPVPACCAVLNAMLSSVVRGPLSSKVLRRCTGGWSDGDV